MPADGSSAAVLSVGGLQLPYSLISLVTLTVQNSALTILLHYSRTSPNAKPYSAAAAVLLNEILKGLISVSVALNNIEPPAGHPQAHARYSSDGTAPLSSSHSRALSLSQRKRSNSLAIGQEEAWGKTRPSAIRARPPLWCKSLTQWRYRTRRLAGDVASSDCWKLAVPACCYVLQNNLQFVAASNLDVATFQVSYQMKILTTAFFSVTMLHKRLSRTKWACLLALAVGVAIVQLQSAQMSSRPGAGHSSMDPFTGFSAVIMACITSGFAGVYFEKVLKGSLTDLWVRNVQLTLFSLPPALLPALLPNLSTALLSQSSKLRITHPGSPTWLFGNFGGWALAVVACQVFGGLVTALVIRYSDNIAKGFATSLSIIISFLAGIFLFSYPVTLPFVVGCSIVLAATWFYNQPDRDLHGKGRTSNLYSPLSAGANGNSNTSHAIEVTSASPDMNDLPHQRYPMSTVSNAPDPIYPFAQYPSKTGLPPKFINVSPFTTPAQSFQGVMEDLVSPRSPVPPNIEGQPFGPPIKYT